MKSKIVGRNGRELNAGSAVKDHREADWLAAQMAACVGLDRRA